MSAALAAHLRGCCCDCLPGALASPCKSSWVALGGTLGCKGTGLLPACQRDSEHWWHGIVAMVACPNHNALRVPALPRFCVSGVPVSSRVSAKIQQLVNTLKRPKRPPLREFFVDDFEELLEGKPPMPPSCRTSVSPGP